MKDLYDILGIEKTANDAEIKKAYRKKAQEFHPDRNPGNAEAEQKFKEVQNAYDTLGDPQKRAHYDQFGQTEGPGGFGGGFGGRGFEDFGNFADIFESFFSGGGRQTRTKKTREEPGRDIEARINISFEESIFGTTRSLEITKPERCETCFGHGLAPGSTMKDCSHCHGNGYIHVQRKTLLGVMQSTQACPECEGTGKIPEKKCTDCHGEGRKKKTVTQEVKIPAGIEDGTTLRMNEKGSAGRYGGPHGDLFLKIQVSSHPRFERHGDSIFSSQSIKLSQAVLGDTILVETVHGKKELKIPAGTSSGQEFTLKEMGAPNLRHSKLGDHHVQINIEIPHKLSKEAHKLFEALKEEGL